MIETVVLICHMTHFPLFIPLHPQSSTTLNSVSQGFVQAAITQPTTMYWINIHVMPILRMLSLQHTSQRQEVSVCPSGPCKPLQEWWHTCKTVHIPLSSIGPAPNARKTSVTPPGFLPCPHGAYSLHRETIPMKKSLSNMIRTAEETVEN